MHNNTQDVLMGKWFEQIGTTCNHLTVLIWSRGDQYVLSLQLIHLIRSANPLFFLHLPAIFKCTNEKLIPEIGRKKYHLKPWQSHTSLQPLDLFFTLIFRSPNPPVKQKQVDIWCSSCTVKVAGFALYSSDHHQLGPWWLPAVKQLVCRPLDF